MFTIHDGKSLDSELKAINSPGWAQSAKHSRSNHKSIALFPLGKNEGIKQCFAFTAC